MDKKSDRKRTGADIEVHECVLLRSMGIPSVMPDETEGQRQYNSQYLREKYRLRSAAGRIEQIKQKEQSNVLPTSAVNSVRSQDKQNHKSENSAKKIY